MRLPPLLKLITEMITLKELLVNRFTILVAIILITSGGVVAYVGQNDGGEITGEVVTESGEPVPDATVELQSIPLQGVVASNSTNTTAQGTFEFTEMESLLEYRLVIRIDGNTVHKGHYHLMFRGQNREHRIVIDSQAA